MSRWQQSGIPQMRARLQTGNRAPHGAPVDTALTWITVDPRSR